MHKLMIDNLLLIVNYLLGEGSKTSKASLKRRSPLECVKLAILGLECLYRLIRGYYYIIAAYYLRIIHHYYTHIATTAHYI